MRFILASQSPRRIALLKSLNFEFESVPSHTEEQFNKNDHPQVTVMSLAFEKAYDIAKKYPDAIVLAFDTIVYKDAILGKPKDEADAFEMLSLLSGQTHEVFTGLSIVCLEKNLKISDAVMTEVTFKDLSLETIKRYINTGEPLDKAGAYGIQGYGALLIESIKGDYFSVMGLPLSKLNEHLINHLEFSLL